MYIYARVNWCPFCRRPSVRRKQNRPENITWCQKKKHCHRNYWTLPVIIKGTRRQRLFDSVWVGRPPPTVRWPQHTDRTRHTVRFCCRMTTKAVEIKTRTRPLAFVIVFQVYVWVPWSVFFFLLIESQTIDFIVFFFLF